MDPSKNWKKPGFRQDEDYPVTCVSWNDAQAFLTWLSERPDEMRSGRTYRLPTEAEWECGCRGATSSSTPFHFGNALSSTQANFDGNYPYGGAAKGPYLERTCKVGSYPANVFGLYDMHGNVWEWCSDWYDEDYYDSSPRKDPTGPTEGTVRVLRGGSWLDDSMWCRSASRGKSAPINRFYNGGFRVVCVPPS